MIRTKHILIRSVVTCVLFFISTQQVFSQKQNNPAVIGLDHIPVAVKHLETAADTFRRLGFSLKPGRFHENSIRNMHVKFRNGTEIELITADNALDQLSAEYIRYIERGSGLVFAGFYAPDINFIMHILDSENRKYNREFGLISFPQADPLRYIFFGSRTPSPTDIPEYFIHRNSAAGLAGVWFAGDDFSEERKLFEAAGAKFFERDVYIPGRIRTAIAEFKEAFILFLPDSYQVIPGRRIIGATINVEDLEKVRSTLREQSLIDSKVMYTEYGNSIFVSPETVIGFWLEFREIR